MSNETWPKVPITEVLSFIVDNRGKTVPTAETGFPLIATNCVLNERLYPVFDKIRFVSEDTLNNWFRAHLQPNDILFVNKGTPGRCCLVPNPVTFCAAQDMVGLRCDPDKIYYKYLLMALRAPSTQKFIANYHVGIAIPHFKKEDFSNLMIPLPKMEEQIILGDFYFSICEAIENNYSICSDLEAMAMLLYDYWFVQFDFPDEKGKPYKSSGGKMVWNEGLKRKIPVEWKVKPLGSIIKSADKSKIQVKGAKDTGLYPFFTSGNSILAYDDYFVDGFNCFLNTGGNPDIKCYKGKCAYSTDTWCINAGKYSYWMYLYFISIMPQFEQLFFAGSGLKHLQKDALKNQLVPLPADNVIDAFNLAVESIFEKVSTSFIENKQLESLRDFILPMLMSGQVEVSRKHI